MVSIGDGPKRGLIVGPFSGEMARTESPVAMVRDLIVPRAPGGRFKFDVSHRFDNETMVVRVKTRCDIDWMPLVPEGATFVTLSFEDFYARMRDGARL